MKKKRGAPILCRVKRCARVYPPDHPRAGERIPFQTYGGLSSHRRRAHGLAAIGTRDRRPKNGRYPCDVPGCRETRPYQTLGGLGVHKRKQHGIVSSSKSALKKAAQRAKRRGGPSPSAAVRRPPPPPAPTGFPPHVPRRPHGDRVDPGRREYIRVRLVYMINGPWAREIDTTPAAVRDLVEDLCRTNFAPPKIKTNRVSPADAYGSESSAVASARGAKV